jgi:hypothetical protein
MVDVFPGRTVNFTLTYFYSCVNLQMIRGAKRVEMDELVEGKPGDSQ